MITTGNDPLRKGLDLALDAAAALDTKGLTLAIIGDEEKMRAFITERLGEVPDWVKILSFRSDIETYYRASDVFLAPSRSEGKCFMIAEAIACGTLVVRSDSKGQDWGVGSELVFPSGDATALRDKIIEALAMSDEARRALLEKQRAYLAEHYDLANWARGITALYAETLKRERPFTVCLVMNMAALYGGSFMDHIFRLIEELKKDGNRAVLVFPPEVREREWFPRVEAAGCPVYFFTPGRNLKDAALFHALVKKHGVDVFHFHFYERHYKPLLAKLLSPRVKMIYHLHAEWVCPRSWPPPVRLLRNTLLKAYADKICACGEQAYDNLLAEGFAPAKCSFVSNCIDFNRFTPPPVLKREREWMTEKRRRSSSPRAMTRSTRVLIWPSARWRRFTQGYDCDINEEMRV